MTEEERTMLCISENLIDGFDRFQFFSLNGKLVHRGEKVKITKRMILSFDQYIDEGATARVIYMNKDGIVLKAADKKCFVLWGNVDNTIKVNR